MTGDDDMILDTLFPRYYTRSVVHYDTPLPGQIMAHIQQTGYDEAAVQLTDGTAPLGGGDYAQYTTLITLKDVPALAADLEAHGEEWLNAVKTRADDEQARSVRDERNRRLQASDTYMLLDRHGLTVPEGSTFTAWIDFLQSFGRVLTGAWARYRQALRDVPEQDGFPWNVTWPEEPEA